MSKASDRTRRMKAMFGEPQPEHSDHQRSSSRTSSAGAVRSIESSLSQIEQENELLRGQLAGKGHVIELDANLVEMYAAWTIHDSLSKRQSQTWILGLLACTCITLIPAALLEPR